MNLTNLGEYQHAKAIYNGRNSGCSNVNIGIGAIHFILLGDLTATALLTLGESTMEQEKILVVTVSATNLKKRVRGLAAAYQYISGIAGHFTYQIRLWDKPSILVEKGEL